MKHDKVNESIRGIRSQSQRLFNGLKTSQAGRGKMVALYQSALTQCESEQDNLEKLLSDIQRRRQLYFRHKIADKLSRGSLLVLIGLSLLIKLTVITQIKKKDYMHIFNYSSICAQPTTLHRKVIFTFVK